MLSFLSSVSYFSPLACLRLAPILHLSFLLSPPSASLHHLSFCFTSLPYRILFVYYCMRVHVSPVSHTGTARVA